MTGLLASICSVEEAAIALHAGADIIDCKDPSAAPWRTQPRPDRSHRSLCQWRAACQCDPG